MPRAYAPKMSTVHRAQRVMRILHPEVRWYLFRHKGHTSLHWREEHEGRSSTLVIARLRDLETEAAAETPPKTEEVICECGKPSGPHSPLYHWWFDSHE